MIIEPKLNGPTIGSLDSTLRCVQNEKWNSETIHIGGAIFVGSNILIVKQGLTNCMIVKGHYYRIPFSS